MTALNSPQMSDWNGQKGETWAANQQRFDSLFAAYGSAALAAASPQPGERALDIGCGAGASSLALAHAVAPGGSVTAADISGPLLALARTRAAAANLTIDFRFADASSEPFPTASFDLLFSRFGVMFFDDPASAFAGLRAALKPGGRLAFVCWRAAAENEWVRIVVSALDGILPPPAPPDPEAPGPFAFGDRNRIVRILTAAGFRDLTITPFDAPLDFGVGVTPGKAVDDALALSLKFGPFTRMLESGAEDARRRALDAVRAAFARACGPRGVVLNGAAWIVTGRAWPAPAG